MNEQEIFDKIVGHLRQQGCKSFDNISAQCKYRGPNGTKCAAGCLIENEEYHPDMENQQFNCNFTNEFNLIRFDPYIDLILHVQNIHDSTPLNCWEEEFFECAERFGLKYTPKDKG